LLLALPARDGVSAHSQALRSIVCSSSSGYCVGMEAPACETSICSKCVCCDKKLTSALETREVIYVQSRMWRKDDERKGRAWGGVRVLIPGQHDLSLMHDVAKSCLA
jgi:hypothetical protein